MSKIEYIEDILENSNVNKYDVEDTFETKDGRIYDVKITYERIE